MSVTSLLLLSAALAAAPEPGLLGVRFQTLAEGAVITEVIDGMGAAAVGVQVGDRILAVDGAPVDTRGDAPAEALRARLLGEPGTDVALTLGGPLGGPAREVVVRRGLVPPDDAPRDEIIAFRRALDRGTARAVKREAKQLVRADFGGLPPRVAVARALRGEGRARPDLAVLAARIFCDARPDDVDLRFLLGEALFRASAYAEAALHLAAVEASRVADVLVPGQPGRGDLGGNAYGRQMLATSLYRSGDAAGASAQALALARTQQAADLLAELRLPPPVQTRPWTAALTPVPPLNLTLLDGAPWSLSAANGHPVLITFWATWCGPCQQELPELQRLYTERHAQGLEILAISLDDARDRPAVERMTGKLGLTFPVAHAPELADRFNIGPIPALRLLDRAHALRYASEGYSAEGFERLTAEVTAALSAPEGGPAVLGDAWSAGAAELLRFLPSANMTALGAAPGGVLVGRSDGPPYLLTDAFQRPTDAPLGVAEGGRVAWLDGPAAIDPGEPWVRAWTPEGAPRWWVTLPGAARDLVALGDRLWVATDAGLVSLDTLGQGTRTRPDPLVDLAAGTDGLQALGERALWRPDGSAAPLSDGACVTADGHVASLLVEDCVSGAFGPDGAARVVASRADGAIIGLDSAGQPAFVLRLQRGARLLPWDPDGDGHDDLLALIPGQGLAWIALSLP